MAKLSIAAPAQAATGDIFTVEVLAAAVSNLGSFELVMSYDRQILRAQGAELGPLLGSTGRTTGVLGPTIDHGAGTISLGGYSHGQKAGAGDDGVLARLSFLAIGPGSSPLHFQRAIVTDIAAKAVAVQTTDGAVATAGDPIPQPGGRIFLPVTRRGD